MQKRTVFSIVGVLCGVVLLASTTNAMFGAPAQERQVELDKLVEERDKAVEERDQMEMNLTGRTLTDAERNMAVKEDMTDQEVTEAFTSQWQKKNMAESAAAPNVAPVVTFEQAVEPEYVTQEELIEAAAQYDNLTSEEKVSARTEVNSAFETCTKAATKPDEYDACVEEYEIAVAPLDYTEIKLAEQQRLDDYCFRAQHVYDTYFTLYDYYEIERSNCISGTPGAYYISPEEFEREDQRHGAETLEWRYTFMNGSHIEEGVYDPGMSEMILLCFEPKEMTSTDIILTSHYYEVLYDECTKGVSGFQLAPSHDLSAFIPRYGGPLNYEFVFHLMNGTTTTTEYDRMGRQVVP